MDVVQAMGSTSKSEQPVNLKRMAFFDLPAELRARIYHLLFKGHEIAIRLVDTTTTWKESGELVVKKWVSRDRRVGTNIIFASKATLAETRPMLLALASFDFNNRDLFPNSTVHPQVLQGFGYTEFQSVHSIIYPGPRRIQYFLGRMPSLHAVSIHDASTKCTTETLDQFRSQCARGQGGFVEALISSWRYVSCQAVLDRLRSRAERRSLQIHLLVGSKAKFKGRTAKVWVWIDAVKETIWVTDTQDQNEVLIPERKEPGLVAALG